MLAIRGQVLPVTTESVCLVGRTKNGSRVEGELNITTCGPDLEELWLEPRNAKPLPEVLKAISNADLIVLGPGSLFTSVIPNLLVEEVSNAILNSSAPVVYVCNLMTQPLETEGFSVWDHAKWIAKVLRRFPISLWQTLPFAAGYIFQIYRGRLHAVACDTGGEGEVQEDRSIPDRGQII